MSSSTTDVEEARVCEILFYLDTALKNGLRMMDRREGIICLHQFVEREWTALAEAGVIDRSYYLEIVATGIETDNDTADLLHPVIAPCLYDIVTKLDWPSDIERIANELGWIVEALKRMAQRLKNSLQYVQPDEPESYRRFVQEREHRKRSKFQQETSTHGVSEAESLSEIPKPAKGKLAFPSPWTDAQRLTVLELNARFLQTQPRLRGITAYVHEQYNTAHPDAQRTDDDVSLERRILINRLHYTAESFRLAMQQGIAEGGHCETRHLYQSYKPKAKDRNNETSRNTYGDDCDHTPGVDADELSQEVKAGHEENAQE